MNKRLYSQTYFNQSDALEERHRVSSFQEPLPFSVSASVGEVCWEVAVMGTI